MTHASHRVILFMMEFNCIYYDNFISHLVHFYGIISLVLRGIQSWWKRHLYGFTCMKWKKSIVWNRTHGMSCRIEFNSMYKLFLLNSIEFYSKKWNSMIFNWIIQFYKIEFNSFQLYFFLSRRIQFYTGQYF